MSGRVSLSYVLLVDILDNDFTTVLYYILAINNSAVYPRACFSRVLLTKSKAVLFSFKMGVPEENENYRPRREGRGITWFSGGTERGISRHNSNSDLCFYEVESHTFDFGFRSSICGYRFKIFPFRTSDLRFRTFQFGVLSSISDLRLRILEI